MFDSLIKMKLFSFDLYVVRSVQVTVDYNKIVYAHTHTLSQSLVLIKFPNFFCVRFRYTKNLSSDKINISTFGGEGELSNLQLDEKVLTELLELPGWLKLTSAWCNHVSFKISWTKLKSTPITLVKRVLFSVFWSRLNFVRFSVSGWGEYNGRNMRIWTIWDTDSDSCSEFGYASREIQVMWYCWFFF